MERARLLVQVDSVGQPVEDKMTHVDCLIQVLYSGGYLVPAEREEVTRELERRAQNFARGRHIRFDQGIVESGADSETKRKKKKKRGRRPLVNNNGGVTILPDDTAVPRWIEDVKGALERTTQEISNQYFACAGMNCTGETIPGVHESSSTPPAPHSIAEYSAPVPVPAPSSSGIAEPLNIRQRSSVTALAERAKHPLQKIANRLPELDCEMREVLHVYCPNLLIEDDLPEQLMLVQDAQGVYVLCLSEDGDRICNLTGGEKIINEALFERLSINTTKEKWVCIRLSDAHSGIRVGQACGEFLSGSSNVEEAVERRGANSEQRRHVTHESLPRVSIVYGFLSRNNITTKVHPGDGGEHLKELQEKGSEIDKVKHLSDLAKDQYVIFDCQELNIQILVSNNHGMAMYVVPGINSPEEYVGISPFVLQRRFNAQPILWYSEAQFMRAIEHLILDKQKGLQLHRADVALSKFPDVASCKLLKEELDKISRNCEKAGGELTVGDICHDVRASCHDTFSMGMASCGQTWLDGVAKAIGLRVPRLRKRVEQVVRGCGLKDLSPEEQITGLAKKLEITAETYVDLAKQLIEKYKINKPTETKIIRVLANEVGKSNGCEVTNTNKIKHAYRGLAIRVVLWFVYPERRSEKEKEAILALAKENESVVYEDIAVKPVRTAIIMIEKWPEQQEVY
jgi:hypothetical protein